MVGTLVTHNVSTELAYWTENGEKTVTIDFTQPDAEKRYEEVQKYRAKYPMSILDIRGRQKEFTLEKNGFQYVEQPIHELANCTTEDEIAKTLLPATEQLVKEVTGATKTIVFTHRIRSKIDDKAKRADNKSPALSVHSDFTTAGALGHLQTVIKDDAEREKLLEGRVYIINVWRPLKTVYRDPLAVCDWKSIDSERDLTAHRFIFPDRWNELGAIKHSDDHKWYYMREQTASEPLIFKQFDSNLIDEGGVTLAHSAFVDPQHADGPARESMEIKMFAFVPKA